MESLAQFKQRLNISQIDLMQGKGRMFAKIGNDTDLVVGTTTDLNKELFVMWNDKGFYCLVNSAAKVVKSI